MAHRDRMAVSEGTGSPLLQVVRGAPTPEQLAALLAVLASRPAPAEPSAAVRQQWGRPILRTPLTPGPGAWQRSALPG